MNCQPLKDALGRVHGFACGSSRAAEHAPPFYPDPCPYCGLLVVLGDAAYIYYGQEGLNSVWVCGNYPACDAYVGCHPGTTRPLGRLANATLRRWKRAAHDAFDDLWRRKMVRDNCSKSAARTAAYAWLQRALNLSAEACHIGEVPNGP